MITDSCIGDGVCACVPVSTMYVCVCVYLSAVMWTDKQQMCQIRIETIYEKKKKIQKLIYAIAVAAVAIATGRHIHITMTSMCK